MQAQYTLRRHDVAYDSIVLFGGDLRRDREAEEEFFSRAKEQAARGSIRVHVPQELVKYWQAEAQGQEWKR